MSTISADTISNGAGTGAPAITDCILVKAMSNLDGLTGALATNDSLNLTSTTDNGTGDYTSTWTNSFDATTYAFTTGAYRNSVTGVNFNQDAAHTPAVGSWRGQGENGANSVTDLYSGCVTCYGDLA